MSDDILKDISDWALSAAKELPKAIKKIEAHRKKIEKEETDQWNKEFGEIQIKLYEGAFDKAIQAFYDDYEPDFYKRRYSLFRAWRAIPDDDGSIVGTVPTDDGWGIDEELLVSANIIGERTGAGMRSGLGTAELFNQAFIEGWHGGAKKIGNVKAKTWGEHPFPGVPYYRRPGWITDPRTGNKAWHMWGAWGKRASRMWGGPNDKPKGIFLNLVKEINDTTLAEEDDKLFEKHQKNLIDKCLQYQNEVLLPIVSPDWAQGL